MASRSVIVVYSLIGLIVVLILFWAFYSPRTIYTLESTTNAGKCFKIDNNGKGSVNCSQSDDINQDKGQRIYFIPEGGDSNRFMITSVKSGNASQCLGVKDSGVDPLERRTHCDGNRDQWWYRQKVRDVREGETVEQIRSAYKEGECLVLTNEARLKSCDEAGAQINMRVIT
jgi:hypothetical protein